MSNDRYQLANSIEKNDTEGLLNIIRESSLQLDNGRDQTGGFECLMLLHGAAADSPTVNRVCAEWEGSNHGFFVQSYFGGVHVAVIDGSGFVLPPNSYWLSMPASWTLKMGSPDSKNTFWLGDRDKNLGNIAFFSLSGYFQKKFTEPPSLVSWDRPTRTLRIDNARGDQYFARFRSPSDTMKIGCELSEFRCIQKEQAVCIALTRFHATNDVANRQFPLTSPSDIAFDLGEKCTLGEVDWEDIPRPHVEQRGVSTLFWYTLFGKNFLEGSVSRKTYDEASDFEKIQLLAISYPSIFDIKDENETLELIRETWRLLKWVSNERYRRNGQVLDIDDEAIRWRQSENIVGPVNLWTLFHLTSYLQSRTDSSGHFEHAATLLGDFGHPPFDGNGVELSKSLNTPLKEAVYFSHWQWPLTNAHRDALRNVLENHEPGSRISIVATHCMVIAGLFDAISDDRMQMWFNVYVATETHETRMRMLTRLTFHQAGQEYLLNRLLSGNDPEPLQKEMLAILTARADATEKLQSYDFMSRDTIEAIRAIGQK